MCKPHPLLSPDTTNVTLICLHLACSCREFVVASLPQLQWLDGREVSKSERILATQVHQSHSMVVRNVTVGCIQTLHTSLICAEIRWTLAEDYQAAAGVSDKTSGFPASSRCSLMDNVMVCCVHRRGRRENMNWRRHRRHHRESRGLMADGTPTLMLTCPTSEWATRMTGLGGVSATATNFHSSGTVLVPSPQLNRMVRVHLVRKRMVRGRRGSGKSPCPTPPSLALRCTATWLRRWRRRTRSQSKRGCCTYPRVQGSVVVLSAAAPRVQTLPRGWGGWRKTARCSMWMRESTQGISGQDTRFTICVLLVWQVWFSFARWWRQQPVPAWGGLPKVSKPPHDKSHKLSIIVFHHRFMDTSLIDCDVQPTYVHLTMKGKVSLPQQPVTFHSRQGVRSAHSNPLCMWPRTQAL